MEIASLLLSPSKDSTGLEKDKDGQPKNGAAMFASVLAQAGMKLDSNAISVQPGQALNKVLERGNYRPEAPERPRPAAERPDAPQPHERQADGGREAPPRSERADTNSAKADKAAAKAGKAQAKAERQAAKNDAAPTASDEQTAAAEPVEPTNESAAGETIAQAADGQVTADETVSVVEATETMTVGIAAMMAQTFSANDETVIAAPQDGGPMGFQLAVIDDSKVANDDQTFVAAVAVASETVVAQVAETVLTNGNPAKTETVQTQAKTDMAADGPKVAASPTEAAAIVAQSDDDQAAPVAQVATNSQANDQAALLAKIVGTDTPLTVTVASKEPAVTPIQTASAAVASVAILAAEAMDDKAQSNLADQADDFRNPGQGTPTHAQQTPAALQAADNSRVAALAADTTSTFADAMAAQQVKGAVVVQTNSVHAETEIGAAGATQASAPANSNGALAANANQPAQPTNAPKETQAAHQPHEFRLPIPAKELIDQVSVQIDKAAKDGLDRITIKLHPESLGKIEVRLDMGQDGRINATIVADRPDTLDALKKDSRDLERALQDAGLKADANSLNFSLKGEREAERQNQFGKNGRQTGRGFALDEAEPDAIAATPVRARAYGRRGVDIQV
ncbi:MAG: flagellar hook-length control protein FliK [Rhodospirillales bacterium]|nr:flagellar hook-length control protein FliK [Rhodospirillales bacterium]